MSSKVISLEQFDIREVIDHVDNIKILMELKEIDEVDLSLFKESFIKLLAFLESDYFIKFKDELTIETSQYDSLIRTVKLFKVALNYKKTEKITQLYEQLLDLGFIEFTEDLLNLLSESKNNPYGVWKKTNSNIINKLSNEFTESFYQHDTIKEFVSRFRDFIGPKLHVKLIKKSNNQFEMSPVIFLDGNFVELKHPITNKRWLISGNPSNYLDILSKLKIGDILKVNYRSVSKNATQFYKSFITIEYVNCEVLEKDINILLKENFSEVEIEEIYRNFSLKGKDSKLLLNELIKILVPKSKALQKGIEEQKVENLILESEFEGLKKEQQHFLEDMEKIKSKFTHEQKKWSQILERIEYQIEDINNSEKAIPYQKETFISDLQARIYYGNEDQLVYDRSILELFMSAIRSNILTILTGPSGTGKSSLVAAIGKAISNAVVTMIPVQSSWTDAQDLLGYFHPNEKIFVATPFMEALVAARIAEEKNKDELHIICLDEMNLAHIEYYFAQFLSIREQQEPSIQLYPSRYEKLALGVEAGDIEANNCERENAKELITYYPSNFKIPSNVRFVGTLNMDHTVKSLSPKVVDRSVIIELLKPADEVKIIEQIEGNGNNYPIKISLDEFNEPITEINESIVQQIKEISNVFEQFRDIPLNSRGLKHLRLITTYWFAVSDEELITLVDLLIKGKVLPRIEEKKSALDNLNTEIVRLLKKYPISNQKMQDMLNTNHTVSFW